MTLYQMAVITQMVTEYNEILRGYFPRTNKLAIKKAFLEGCWEALDAKERIEDGRYITK